MRFTFRLADLPDASLVRNISAAAYLPIIGTTSRPANEDYGPWIGSGEVWLAKINGEPSGVIVLEHRPDHLFVYSVAVLPRCQGRGLGRALLELTDRRAALTDRTQVRLYTNKRVERNVRLFLRCGYVILGERSQVSQPGEILVDMVKYVPANSQAGTSA